MFSKRRKRALIGLDITTSSIKLIELSEAGGNYCVEAYAAEPTPPAAINEKAIIDADAVGEAVRRAVKRSGTKAREAAIAISGEAAITKVVRMPKNLSAAELEAQVELEAGPYIPFPMEEVSYDFEIIGESTREPDMLDVLLVATRTENVEQRQVAVDAAGLTPRVVDIEAFAVENACQLLTHEMPEVTANTCIAVVDFGASTTTFSVLEHAKVIYTRDFAFGGQQLTEEIMRTYGLSLEDAGRSKKAGGLPSNYEPEVLEAFVADMAQQVSRSLQLFLASGGGRDEPGQILICGGCANIPGVADVIGRRVGIRAGIGDPLGRMELSSRARAQGVAEDATALLTACGLALRRFDRKPRINLLPWREEQRQDRKKKFVTSLIAAVFCAAAVTYGYKFLVQAQISNQEQRNEILREEITALDEQIAAIDDLEARKARLVARMQIIDELQRSRPEIVHLFDELADALPEGVYLRSVAQDGRRVEIRGTAQSSTRVSAMMRSIEGSEWLRAPGLSVIDTVDQGGSARVANFTIFAQQVSITEED